MRFPTVSGCCCCFDLKTAGTLLGIWGIIGGALLLVIPILLGVLVGSIHYNLIIAFAVILIIFPKICWLYGLHGKDKSSFMLPAIIIDAIEIVFASLPALIVSLFGLTIKFYAEYNDWRIDVEIGPVGSTLILLIIAILWIYFWIVEYSVYRHMKYIEQNNLPVHFTPPNGSRTTYR